MNNPGFFDRKTILAVASVAIVYGGWQYYLTQKYPSYGKPATAVSPVTTQDDGAAKAPTENPAAVANSETNLNSDSKSVVAGGAALAEQVFEFSGKHLGFQVSSFGMGLKNVTLKGYTDKQGEQVAIGQGGASLFSLKIAGAADIAFRVIEKSPGAYVGEAKIGSMNIIRELTYNEDNNSFTNKVTILNPEPQVLQGISFVLPDTIVAETNSSFLFPSYELQDFFVIHSGSAKETVNYNHAKENINQEFKVASTVAVGSHYFASALLDRSSILPDVRLVADVSKKTASAEVVYKPTTLSDKIVFEQTLYAGPKSIDALKAIDSTLAKIVDFGFFGFIATPLLYVMKFFHGLVGNWGLAIILLTLLVRFAVLPFNIMSFRSMKAMQKIQPAVQSLREKYKEDPMRLNQEMMSLMKENGANPLGGCLPMLLQIPIFFALYRVISSSVELYQSPFMLWISDLSVHDKFYVLPIIMAVAMYFQQKLTPTTMDPMQAKIMTFLPVIMCLFMLQLPSGLTLYMCVSTLFGIAQQYIIMRDSKPALAK